LDIDGNENTVYAVDAQPLPLSEDNLHGLGLVEQRTPLRSESEGRQDYDWSVQRTWHVVNEDSRNGLGEPVAYKLVPGGAIPSLLDPSSPVLRRAKALEHTLWVTPFHEDERWPCGQFPNLSSDDKGLAVWTASDRS